MNHKEAYERCKTEVGCKGCPAFIKIYNKNGRCTYIHKFNLPLPLEFSTYKTFKRVLIKAKLKQL